MNIFFKFLWNSGPDRIKRRIIVKNTACGGLRMVEIKSFIKALKVSWFRRILHQSKPNEWTNLSLISFDMLFSVGGSYAFKLGNDIQNPFWKDLMFIWAEHCKILPVDNIGHILESSLWYNEKIGRGKLFFKNLHEKGIRIVQDIIAENGDLYTFEQLKAMYNINGTFLHYHQLIHNISPLWINQINDNYVFTLENKTNVICNTYVKNLIRVKKGSRIF